MALKKFELKKEHVAMIRAIEWNDKAKYIFMETIPKKDRDVSPFGGNSLIADLKLILVGKPLGKFLVTSDEGPEYTPEQEEMMGTLTDYYKELPMALDVVSYTQSYELGMYGRNWYDRNWRKLKPKLK